MTISYPYGDVDWYPCSPFGRASWLPSTPPGILQWTLDGDGYDVTQLSLLPILKSKEPGTVAQPRGQRCALFDGTNDYGTLGARLTSGSVSTLTACAWVKTTGTSVTIVGEYTDTTSNRSWQLSVSASGKLRVIVSADGTFTTVIKDYSSTTSINTGSWFWVAFSFDAGVLKLYVNGVEESTTKTTDGTVSSVFNSASHFAVGCRSASTTPAGFFPGSIRDVRVYSVAKSSGEIAAIYNQASTPSAIDTTGLLGMWPLQEESGTSAYDCSGNGKHLTLTNITQGTFHAVDTGVTWNVNNWKGHTVANNLLTYSEQFDNAAWAKSGATVTANDTTDPLGGNTADKIVFSGSSQYVRQSVTLASQVTTISVWIKGTAGETIELSNFGTAATLVTLTGAWQRASFASTSSNPFLAITTYGGATARTVWVWGAQLEPGSTATQYTPTTTSVFSNVVIPDNLASPTLDAAGNALGVAGPVAHPATMEVPCVTGDGSAAYCDLGSALIPATADFTLSLWYYHVTNNTTIRTIFSQRLSGSSEGRFAIHANLSPSIVATAGALVFFIGGTNTVQFGMNSGLTAGAWHRIVFSRVGSVFSATVTIPATGVSFAFNATVSGVSIDVSRNVWLLASDVSGFNYNDGRICDLRITTGGVAKYFPLHDGPGTSNTNRDLAWVASDGTGGVVSNAIVNGTVSTIWANRCPYAQDWCVNYGGGIAANGAFIPGRIGSANDAAGNAKTLSAGKHGNPYSGLCPNAWSAPELVNIGYTSSTKLAPSDAVQSISPNDSKLRRNKSTGSDRYLAYQAALAGSNLTNANSYVG